MQQPIARRSYSVPSHLCVTGRPSTGQRWCCERGVAGVWKHSMSYEAAHLRGARPKPFTLLKSHDYLTRWRHLRNHGMSVRCLWTRGQKAMLKSWYLLLPVHLLLLLPKCGGTCFQLLKFKTGSFAWKVGGHIMISKPRLLHGLCWRGSWRL